MKLTKLDWVNSVNEIKETKYWFACDVRELCIRKDWYTMGDCASYDTMLEFVNKHTPCKMNIFKVAQDIVAHSDIEKFCDETGLSKYSFFKCVMFELNGLVNTTYEMGVKL